MKRMIKFSEGGDPTLSGPKSDLGGRPCARAWVNMS